MSHQLKKCRHQPIVLLCAQTLLPNGSDPSMKWINPTHLVWVPWVHHHTLLSRDIQKVRIHNIEFFWHQTGRNVRIEIIFPFWISDSHFPLFLKISILLCRKRNKVTKYRKIGGFGNIFTNDSLYYIVFSDWSSLLGLIVTKCPQKYASFLRGVKLYIEFFAL